MDIIFVLSWRSCCSVRHDLTWTEGRSEEMHTKGDEREIDGRDEESESGNANASNEVKS